MNDISFKINTGYYEAGQDFDLDDPEQEEEFLSERDRLAEEFRNDALEYLKIKDNPKGPELYDLAYQRSGAVGLNVVLEDMRYFVALIR